MINVFVLQNGRLNQVPIESRADLENVDPVWVDLTDPDIDATIRALRDRPDGRYLVGIRHQVHDERDPKTGWVPKLLSALAEESALLIEGGAKTDERYMSRVASLAPAPDLPARLNLKE